MASNPTTTGGASAPSNFIAKLLAPLPKGEIVDVTPACAAREIRELERDAWGNLIFRARATHSAYHTLNWLRLARTNETTPEQKAREERAEEALRAIIETVMRVPAKNGNRLKDKREVIRFRQGIYVDNDRHNRWLALLQADAARLEVARG